MGGDRNGTITPRSTAFDISSMGSRLVCLSIQLSGDPNRCMYKEDA